MKRSLTIAAVEEFEWRTPPNMKGNSLELHFRDGAWKKWRCLKIQFLDSNNARKTNRCASISHGKSASFIAKNAQLTKSVMDNRAQFFLHRLYIATSLMINLFYWTACQAQPHLLSASTYITGVVCLSAGPTSSAPFVERFNIVQTPRPAVLTLNLASAFINLRICFAARP